jgi:hypothetical protein
MQSPKKVIGADHLESMYDVSNEKGNSKYHDDSVPVAQIVIPTGRKNFISSNNKDQK